MQNFIKELMHKLTEKFGNILILVLIITLSISLLNSFNNFQAASGQIKKEEERLDRISAENQKLKKQLEEVHSQDYIEKQLRDTLGMSKSGEIVLIMPDEEVVKRFAPEFENEVETLPDPNWKKWLHLFF